MANVSRVPAGDGDGSDRDDGSRGQIILVAGLAVAVTLVALVLLLNTVIYTQNLATRGPAVEDGGAVAFQQEAKSGVGAAIDAENRQEHDNLTLVRRNVTEAVARYDSLSSRYSAGRGTIADVEEDSLSLTNGSLLRQTDESREFRSSDASGGKANWTLVDNTPGVRSFRMTISERNLADANSSTGFSVRVVGDGGEVWKVYVYDDTDDTDEITVAVKNGTADSATRVYSSSSPNVTLDLTAGTVDGTSQPELVWANGVSAPYDVTFKNGTEATGTYALTVNNSSADTDVKTDEFEGPNDEESPQAVPVIYAAEFEIHYETPDLRFHTTVRVARGEPE